VGIALAVSEPIRKSVQGVDVLNTDSVSPKVLSGRAKRVQVPTELVLSKLGWEPLRYHVWVQGRLVDELKEALVKGSRYPLSLGPADFPAWVENTEEAECEVFSYGSITSPQLVSTVVPSLFSIDFEPEKYIVIEERLPRTFSSGRISGKAYSYAYEASGKPIRILPMSKEHGLQNTEVESWKLFRCQDIVGVFLRSVEDGTLSCRYPLSCLTRRTWGNLEKYNGCNSGISNSELVTCILK